MPQFKPEGEHLKEHQEIHKGLDEFNAYIKKCKKGNKDWDGEKMKGIMDSFRDVLFKHLDHEVESLDGENLKKVSPKTSDMANSSVLEIGRVERDICHVTQQSMARHYFDTI